MPFCHKSFFTQYAFASEIDFRRCVSRNTRFYRFCALTTCRFSTATSERRLVILFVACSIIQFEIARFLCDSRRVFPHGLSPFFTALRAGSCFNMYHSMQLVSILKLSQTICSVTATHPLALCRSPHLFCGFIHVDVVNFHEILNHVLNIVGTVQTCALETSSAVICYILLRVLTQAEHIVRVVARDLFKHLHVGCGQPS